MITQLINISTILSKDLKSNYPLINILLDIVKELMLSDLEIVYYPLFLDNLGWTIEYYYVKDNLVITEIIPSSLLYNNFQKKIVNIINNNKSLDKNIIPFENISNQNIKNKNDSIIIIL